MNSILYLECNAGISGDMTVAALLDAGADQKVLQKALDSIPLEGFQTRITRVKKAGLDACDFEVVLEHDNHDHDMAYLHGACHQDEHVSHSHTHRTMKEILPVIEDCEMTEGAKLLAIHIFEILAEAEADAHGVTKDEVHFHEVGAIDSIVDIIAASVCIDNLELSGCIVPVLYEGCGSVRCQHGILPVPVPAVAGIARKYHLDLSIMNLQGEFVTPTGAAIVAAIRTGNQLPDRFQIKRVGMGAGKREYEKPSLLRAMLIQPVDSKEDCIYKLESNVDDCTGENLGYVMERLMEAGARDVHFMPVYMKKNRPAYQLNVICSPEKIEEMENIIFKNTTTIGIRRVKMERTVLSRKVETMETSLGAVKVKVCAWKGETYRYPEYESVAELCRQKNLSFATTYRQIERECDCGKNCPTE